MNYEHAGKPKRMLKPSSARGYLSMADGGSVGDLLRNRGSVIDAAVNGAQAVPAVAPSLATAPVAPAPTAPAAPVGAADPAFMARNGMNPDGTPLAKPSIFKRALSVVGLKSGGKVDGPGGPTADQVPAMLSDGEFVIPADVVKKLGTERFEKMISKHHKPSDTAKMKMPMGTEMMADGGLLTDEGAARRKAVADAFAAGGGGATGAGLATRAALGQMGNVAAQVPGMVGNAVMAQPAVQNAVSGVGSIARFGNALFTGSPAPTAAPPVQASTAPAPVASTLVKPSAAFSGPQLQTTGQVMNSGLPGLRPGEGAMTASDGRKVTFGDLSTRDQTLNVPTSPQPAYTAPGRIRNYAPEAPNPRDIPLDMSALAAPPVDRFAEYQRLRNNGTFSGMGAAKAYLRNATEEAAAKTAATNAETGRIGALAQGANAQERNRLEAGSLANAAARTNFEAANVGSQIAERGVTTQGKIAELGKQKRAEELRQQILEAKTPAERKTLENKLYAITGKPQGKFQIVEQTTMGPDGTTPIKTPYIIDDEGNARPAIQNGAAALPPGMSKQVGTSNGKPVYEDAKGKRFVGG
jgi:hypothetical protein